MSEKIQKLIRDLSDWAYAPKHGGNAIPPAVQEMLIEEAVKIAASKEYRLIAAAPELLEALEAATNALAIESVNRFGNRHFETAKAIETIIAEARAAIAKAKGEAS